MVRNYIQYKEKFSIASAKWEQTDKFGSDKCWDNDG